MTKFSAGILVYREKDGQIEVLLGHPGGPFYTYKDDGVWSLPKGEYDENEVAKDAAMREFEEEIGQKAPSGEYFEIGESKVSNKVIKVWAIEGNLDVTNIKSNNFEMEWPPKSGKKEEFPEIDKAEWFSLEQALNKISKGQIVFIERLAEKLNLKKPQPEQPNQQQLL